MFVWMTFRHGKPAVNCQLHSVHGLIFDSVVIIGKCSLALRSWFCCRIFAVRDTTRIESTPLLEDCYTLLMKFQSVLLVIFTEQRIRNNRHWCDSFLLRKTRVYR
jgi:hypothetical protein